ncbi:MAG: DUF3488 and transglutaminase-like domain-containing protein [Kofleriaceae bacterium]|nr:DUF3488 and transglutaminase-like domain-containing protein [Kofleriaceae bacterium]
MRFAVAHKTASYLMIAFAFLAMTSGGGVAGGLVLGGLLTLVMSWWWEPPRIRFEKWSWVWNTLSVFALAYALLTAIVTGDFLGVGAQFLIWLVVVKAFNRRAARDWQQLYLLSFLMLVAGSVLNPDITYGLCFLGFVLSSTWAMTLFHLRREMEDNLLVKHAAADRVGERVEVRRILESRRIVGGRFFLGTGVLSLGVFLLSAAVFLALPRVGMGFFLKTRGGLTLSGFSDGVKLGGHGVIKQDSTVVMRVEIDSEYGSRNAPAIHWRGVAFDRYQKGEWTRSPNAPQTNDSLDRTRTRDYRYLYYDGPSMSPSAMETLATSWIRQDVWLDPLDSDILFAASMPRIIEYPHVINPKKTQTERNDEIRVAHGSTLHYTAYSQVTPPSPADLRAASGPLPQGFEVYLQLDPAITPRTRAKALEITAGLTNNYDKAMAIKAWLTSNLTYTLELADPGTQEAVDFFLFDRKRGHCEYFASAFAVLARINGIPTRNVNGFLGGEWNEFKGYVAVRAGDAHSWDEVYFPKLGWVTFDATPPGNIDVLGRGGSGWRARLGRMMDTLRFQWTKWVIEYDLASQLELFRTIGRAIKRGALAVKHAAIEVKDRAVDNWPVPTALAVIAIGYVLVRRKRQPAALTSQRRERARVRSTVAEVYDQALKLLAKHGAPREPWMTPRELANQLAQRDHAGAAQVRELTELYYSAEWGGRRNADDEARAAALLRELRTTLDQARQRA